MKKIPITERPASASGACLFSLRKRFLFATFVLLAVAPSVTPQQNAKNVLVLFSSRSIDTKFSDLVELGVRARVRGPINFYLSYLTNGDDTLADTPYQQSQAETFRRRYAGTKLDLVIAVSPQAVYFALEYRNEMFPNVPIVFTQVSTEQFKGRTWPGTTGMTIPLGVRETIDLAMRLHPDATTVAIISGPDRLTLSAEHDELLRYKDKVKEVDLIGPASPDTLKKVSALPSHTVILFQLPPDLDSPEFGSGTLLDMVARRFPTYSAWQNDCLNHGCIGGPFGDVVNQYASTTAEIAARVLTGERPEDIPVVVQSSNTRYVVDWRELQRWHIPESALPPGSVVLYREPTLWERGRNYFLAGIAVIVVQSLLLFGLLWQRGRKQKAEAILRESENRFRVMADTTPSLVWMCDAEGKITYLNEQRIAFTGSEPNVGSGHAWTAYVHPDDQKNVLDVFSNSIKSHQRFSMKYRLRRQDGVYRWMFDVAATRVNGDGSFAGFIGSAVDITDQKIAQEALEKLSGRLIEAQERERSRLARELHDDICQRLSMLSLKIEKVNRSAGRGRVSVADELKNIWQECSDLTGDVQALSHELHPSILDNLGLATAVKSFCREVSEQNGMEVEFEGRDIPNSLPREVSLSLFRVIQEAIHNAIKYSGQKHFEVRLEMKDAQIELEVRDRGVGFHPASMQDGRGLGLVSMAERIHQVNGTFTIDSQPNIGTRIQARVPLVAQPKVMTASVN